MHNHDILNKRLFKAVARNDIKDIQRLIEFGANVNSEFTIDELINNKVFDNNAITIIRKAETTVDNLANSESVDDDTITIMKNNSFTKVIFLRTLQHRIILSIKSKLSPLQLALMYCRLKEVIVELIKEKANPNKALDIQGITILQLMCMSSVFNDPQCLIFDEEIVQLLFDYGADPNIQDIKGKTFLHYAVLYSDFYADEMARHTKSQLLKYQFRNFRYSDKFNNIIIKRIKKFLINGANPNIKDSTNSYYCYTILDYIEIHFCALYSQPDMTNLLLDHACTYSIYEDVLKLMGQVSISQDDRDYRLSKAEEFNSGYKEHVEKNSHLIEAIKSKDKSKVSILLSKGTSPDIRDKDGLSALHLAVKLGNYAIAELLLDKGANPNIKSWKNGTTPLFNAVTSNQKDIAELLLKHTANPSVLNTKGLSPLYFPITNNDEEIKELLLKYKANPDISHHISVLFNVLNEVKNDSDMKTIEQTLKKIKDIAKFIKSKNIPMDYSLFYQSVDIAEKKNKKNTTKKVMELLDQLTSSPVS